MVVVEVEEEQGVAETAAVEVEAGVAEAALQLMPLIAPQITIHHDQVGALKIRGLTFVELNRA